MNNQSQILDGQIKKNDFIFIYENGELVKRKILFVEKTFSGEDCYIIHFKYGRRTTTGRIYKNEIVSK